MEESREWNKKMYLLFIDFEKAFDSIDRDTLWKILNYYGVPDKLVKMIMAIYEDSECCVRTENGDIRFFKIMSGVKQGCVLSPFLFVIVMDYILRQSSGCGVKIRAVKSGIWTSRMTLFFSKKRNSDCSCYSTP